jgi:hypothetical protein
MSPLDPYGAAALQMVKYVTTTGMSQQQDIDLVYPDFTLQSYRRVLEQLACRWQILRLCDAFARPFAPNTLILRHDIDISPRLALPMAEIENSLGIHSTYFAGLHLYYNLHYPRHAEVIRKIAGMGHEIGLHYDGAVYSAGEASLEHSFALLERHIEILEEISLRRVVSIARHNPSISKEDDPFKTGTKYHNAYDDRLFHNTIYISDSCGAWRNDGLSPCWREPRPKRLYLLIHAEQWADRTDTNRMARFEIMRQRAMREHEAFFTEARSAWRNHSGGKQHDQRLCLQENARE